NSTFGPVGPATDLYELGCVAYELFAGSAPFENALAPFRDVPPLPQDAPAGLDELLRDLLSPDAAARPQSATDVLARLDALRAEPRPEAPGGPKVKYEPGDVIDDKFEVRSQL